MTEPTEIKTEGNCRDREPLNHENEPKNLMDSYSKILEQLKLLNENYFKRVQVMMGILQAGLLVAAFGKLSFFPKSCDDALVRIIIGILGILSALMWMRLNTKEAQYLEFCKRILRNLEARLMCLGVPLVYFRAESLIFGPNREDLPEISAGGIETVKLPPSEKLNAVKFKWSEETYPENRDHKGLHSIGKVTGGIISLERRLPQGALGVWILVVVVALLYAALKIDLQTIENIWGLRRYWV